MFRSFLKSLIVLIASLLIVSCVFTKRIKEGSMAFELRQYSVAVELLENEYQSAREEQTLARIAYTIGESYWQMGEVALSIPWYEKAHSHDFGPRALEKTAFALKHLENYQGAVELFTRLLSQGTQIDLYRREIAICRLASDWILDPNKSYEVKKAYFNSRESDYSPYFLNDHQVFFSSDRNNSSSERIYNWTGRGYSDLYMYDKNTGNVSFLDPIINTDSNEGTLSFNEQGSILYFTRCYTEAESDDFCKIFETRLQNGSWSNPQVLPFVEPNANYGHPYWVESDSVMFFSSSKSGGFGGFDLYYTRLTKENNWDDPISLGPTINTMSDEKFPSLKNDTLFFSSNGHPGMGGLDIFYTYIIEKGSWERPINMKSPINSGADDFSLVYAPDVFGYLDKGYFSSSRNGLDDIFEFEKIKNKVIVKDPDVDTETEEQNLKLALTVFKELSDGRKVPFPEAQVLISNVPETLSSRAFIVKNIEEKIYNIQVKAEGYFNKKIEVLSSFSDIPEGKSTYTYNRTLILKPILENQEIVLENILYDFNQFFIREDAKPSLNELVSLLNENPEIIIELSSHTDCRGPDAYNQILSQKRAQSAVEYIISNGIDGERITAKGYGESSPVSSCECDSCTENEHQANRRTAFKIVEIIK